MAKVRRHLWPLPLPGADRGRLPAVQRGPIRFVDAEEEVELTLADGEPVGRVHRGLLGKEDIHRTIGRSASDSSGR